MFGALVFGVGMGVGTWILGTSTRSVVFGLVCGALFLVFIIPFRRWFTRRQSALARAAGPDFGAESVIVEGPANHFRGIEAVGGYLLVTDRRVHFTAHSMNVQSEPWTCSLSDIDDVRNVRLLGIIDKGLQFSLPGSSPQRFVVHDGRRWVDAIRPLLASQRRGG